MFDSRGRVIGVVVWKADLEATAFAVPVATVLRFLGVEDAGGNGSP